MEHRRILLLEDDPLDARLVRSTLTEAGVQADFVTAGSASEYQRALDGKPVDLVISDSSIPGLNPLTALSLAKQANPQTAFIIFSGRINYRLAEQVKAAGAVDWIDKSNLTALVPLVRQVLPAGERATPDEVLKENRRLRWANVAAGRLIRAVRDLSTARDVATIQQIVRTAARELNGADGATFVLRDGEQCYYADEEAIGPLWKGQRFPLSACISGWAMVHRQPAVVPDIALDSRIPLEAYRPTFVRSLVMVPIRAEAPIGAIGNYWATPRTPRPEEVELIQALADATSVAMENVQVYTELEQRVATRTAELEEANQALEEFSYFASHDLRAPVRHLHEYARQLLDEQAAGLSPAARDTVGLIKGAATTMGELLQGLLDLAYAGQQGLRAVELNMTRLAKTAAELARDQAGPTTEFRVGVLPPANGDPLLVRQVWTNLVGNAAKYSSANPQPVVEIGAEYSGDEQRYFVRDNGVGFDMAAAGKMFTAFQRLDTGKGFSGSGVGLAIVHRIITRHGGRIWAESSPGKGATFYFTLG